MAKRYSSILETIGNTPVVRINRLAPAGVNLFVDPATRAKGVGKQLIDWLVKEMRARKWSRLYWATRETNYRARGLYDKYGPHSGFLRYVIVNPDP